MKTTIDMAREAGADTLMYWDIEKLKRFEALVIEKLKRFEALVRADERAACCDAIWKCDGMGLEDRFIAMDVIKARGNT